MKRERDYDDFRDDRPKRRPGVTENPEELSEESRLLLLLSVRSAVPLTVQIVKFRNDFFNPQSEIRNPKWVAGVAIRVE